MNEPKPVSKYTLTWITAQIPAAVVVWLSHAQNHIQPVVTALIGGIWMFLSTFAIKVWKEIEDDAIKSTAGIVRSVPRAVSALCVRAWGWVGGAVARWSPGFSSRYLEALRFEYGLFNDRGLGLVNTNRLDLEKVYVDLKADANVNLVQPHTRPFTYRVGGRASFWTHVRTLKNRFALVIVGAPGSGKTTLLYHILLTYASNRQWRKRMRWRMPFFIELRKIASLLQAAEPPTLPEIIERVLEQYKSSLGKEPPKGWVDARLRKEHCVLLWDGLDEVADANERLKVSAWLDNQIRKPEWKKTLFLVSARPAGYRGAPLERSHVLEVQPFDYEDTHRFIRQWYHANEVMSNGHKDSRAVRQLALRGAEDLRHRLQSNPRISVLTTNPLLLTMVCMVHRYRGALPGSRGQLYAEICQVLLERWRQGKGMQDKYRAEQKLAVLRPLAAYMMERVTKDITQTEAIPIIVAPLSLLGVPQDKAADFLTELQESSGLFLEQEVALWSFAHLSFQEYLCAEQWSRLSPDALPIWADYVEKSWWRETLLLFVSKTPDASAIVTTCLDHNSTPSLVLAFDIIDEKPSLQPAVREQLEETIARTQSSKDLELFQPAARARLLRTQEHGFELIKDRREISGFVTQAEYQLFLLDGLQPWERACAYLPHWRGTWFSGSPAKPALGMFYSAALRYCQWLDEQFMEWSHQLPTGDDLIFLSANPMDRPFVPWTNAGSLAPLNCITKSEAASIAHSLEQILRPEDFLDSGGDRHPEINYLAKNDLDTTFYLRRHSFSRWQDFGLYVADLSTARDREQAHIQYSSRARDLTRNLASAQALSVELSSALKSLLSHERAATVVHTRALRGREETDFDHAVNCVRAGSIAGALSMVFDFKYNKLSVFARAYIFAVGFFDVENEEPNPSRASDKTNKKVSSLEEIKDLPLTMQCLESIRTSANCIEARTAFRKLFITLIHWVEEQDGRLLSDRILQVRRLMTTLMARETDLLPAWEGIRVVRSPRK